MTWVGVGVLAIIEGLTEFLPISSTGHMILASNLLRLEQSEFLKSFEIIIQLGAILAILTKYWKLLWEKKEYWSKIAASFIPTMLIGFVFYKVIKTYFLSNVWITLVSLVVGGILIILIERWYAKKQDATITIETLSIKKAVYIGLIQGLSIIPGVSRAASTIMGGMILGMNRVSAVEYSFLLALPIMIAATGLDLIQTGYTFTQTEWIQLGVGFIIAFIVARLVVDWLVKFVQNHSLAFFGWYRLVLAALFLFLY